MTIPDYQKPAANDPSMLSESMLERILTNIKRGVLVQKMDIPIYWSRWIEKIPKGDTVVLEDRLKGYVTDSFRNVKNAPASRAALMDTLTSVLERLPAEKAEKIASPETLLARIDQQLEVNRGTYQRASSSIVVPTDTRQQHKTAERQVTPTRWRGAGTDSGFHSL